MKSTETLLQSLLSHISYELQTATDGDDTLSQLRLSSTVALLQQTYEMYTFGHLPVNMAATTAILNACDTPSRTETP